MNAALGLAVAGLVLGLIGVVLAVSALRKLPPQ